MHAGLTPLDVVSLGPCPLNLQHHYRCVTRHFHILQGESLVSHIKQLLCSSVDLSRLCSGKIAKTCSKNDNESAQIVLDLSKTARNLEWCSKQNILKHSELALCCLKMNSVVKLVFF